MVFMSLTFGLLFGGRVKVEAKVSTQFTLLDALMEMEENLKEEKG